MEIFLAIVIFVLGAIIGSFLNVVILRYGTGRSFAKGRSMCFSCGKELSAKELIPLVSFLIQRGKCGECHAKISWQYFSVELLTAVVFTLSFLIFPYLSVMWFWIIWSLFIVISVYDLYHKIIPDALVYALAGMGAIMLFVDFGPSITFGLPTLLDALAGPLFFLPFFLLWYFSKGQWIGLGDGKLAWAIGWLLGFSLGGSAIIYAFWIGAVVGIVMMLLAKKVVMKTEIPFAPFLVFATFLTWCFQVEVIDAVARLFPFLS